MKIYLDTLIFSKQKFGGVSVYWYELIKRMINNNLELVLISVPKGYINN
ncbi:hypothetical protein SAMN02982927_03331 [Sporolactobacillus nakayamae]|uniref:Uncharacterized protein n=1 Tax=Sporolactobacillus nakayamae TaxID=269670 RepID=A0A1I2VZS6_9BACL|nr:hypothetical protein SAMN02982927_03331 [Sporolactobacillus nakayamae]